MCRPVAGSPPNPNPMVLKIPGHSAITERSLGDVRGNWAITHVRGGAGLDQLQHIQTNAGRASLSPRPTAVTFRYIRYISVTLLWSGITKPGFRRLEYCRQMGQSLKTALQLNFNFNFNFNLTLVRIWSCPRKTFALVGTWCTRRARRQGEGRQRQRQGT